MRCEAGALYFLFAAAVGLAADLQWTAQAGYRFAAVAPDRPGKVGFTTMYAQATGVSFANHIPAERHYTNLVYLNGSGVAAGDVDGDGWCDLFFCGLGGRSALYRNRAAWKFQDITTESGLAAALSKLDATGAAFADLDGDGDQDLIINSVGQGTFCFWNDGSGRFSPGPVLNQGRCGTSLALADIDSDGALDLYIANYRTSTIRDQPSARFTFKNVNGRPQPMAFGDRPLTEPDLTNRFAFVYQPGAGGGGSVFHDELGEPDVLYRNQGGRFTPASTNALPNVFDWGLSVMMRDFNGDQAPDIYVCNDYATPDRFWLNDGKGNFRAAPPFAIRQTSLSTMAIDVADINRDGFDDIFTADMLSRERWRRLVQKNEPNPNMHLFVDAATQPQSPRNTLQLARGDGTYAEIAQLAGLEAAEWAWASIFLDVDLDGYEDLLVANGFERDYMNMDANLKVTTLKVRTREHPKLNEHYPRLATPNAAFRNLGNLRFADVSSEWGFDLPAVSQGMCLADLDNDGDLDVAINNSNEAATLLRNDTPAARIALRLKGKGANTRGIGAKIKILGGAVPSQTQEMMSGGRYLSSDDSMRVFAAGTNAMRIEVIWRSGMRSVVTNAAANRIYEIDETTASPAKHSASGITPLFKDSGVPLTRNVSGGLMVSNLPTLVGTNSTTTLGDLHGDGQLELFVGSRSVPDRWPEPGPSFILQHTNGSWALDRENSERLSKAGLVSGAVFTDVDGDADVDLVLACEWGPVRVFRNARGVLAEATPEFGLDAYTGWWNAVNAGDFDGDGRMDLIASNWGRNTKYERFRSKPLRLMYGDFNGDGRVVAIEAVHDQALRGYGPIVNVWTLSQSMPWLLEKFNSYEAFSRATLEQALAERGRAAKNLEANWLDSMVFLNRGGRFETRPLPIEAQFAPAFGICVADFDGDGNEDAFLSQNSFAVRTETSRYDAGRGLLLRGDGRGNLTAVSGQESGLVLYGEQREAIAADYDADGRVDLAVTQVGTETKFYRNVTARPGLRVRLVDQAIGAVIRLRFAHRLGPAREIHGHESAVQVIAGQGSPTAIQVRWPGGKVTDASVPRDALEVTIDSSGKLERMR
jgi:hypothetical protein